MKAAQNNYELDSKALQKTKGKSMAGKSETATITMADDRKAGDEDDDMADDDDNDEDMNDEDDDDDDDEEDEMLLDETANTKTGANTSVHHLSQHGLGHRDATLPGTDDCILSGQYVTLVLTGVPLLAVQRLTEKCLFTWFSLFEHEMKMSVLNFNIQRIDGSDEPIKSKQEVIFMVRYLTLTLLLPNVYEIYNPIHMFSLMLLDWIPNLSSEAYIQ